MPSIICVDPSISYTALVSQLAANAGGALVASHQADEAFTILSGPYPCALLIVANQLDGSQSGVELIRSTRLLANRVTTPILFIMSDRDPELARRALQAGATEVVLRSDSALLDSLIHEHTHPAPGPLQTGRALVVEDSASQADYVTQLCLTLGLAVDRCASMEESVEKLQDTDYQIAIVDIVLQGISSGLSLVRHIRQLPPPRSRLPILVMSGYDDASRRIEALRIGADDFLNKPFSEEEFVWRLHRIIQDRSNNSIENTADTVQPVTPWQDRGLSQRECEICQALIQGVNDKQIAADLKISFWTVRTHIGNIFSKLGVLNRRELMARYLPGTGK